MTGYPPSSIPLPQNLILPVLSTGQQLPAVSSVSPFTSTSGLSGLPSAVGYPPASITSTQAMPMPVLSTGHQAPTVPYGSPHTSMTSSAVPIDFHVPVKVKQQIWSNDYFDLSLLLNKSSLAPPDFTYALDLRGIMPTLSAAPPRAQTKISSILQWIDAFEIFVAVYTQRDPTATASLLKHSQVVRALSSLGGDWMHYDEQFRLIRQCKPIPWDEVNTTLWSKALIRRSLKQFPQTQVSVNSQRPQQRSRFNKGQVHPRGFCFRFSGGGTCSSPNCSFAHKCYHCGQPHPASSCTASAQKQRPKPANANQNRKTH